MNKAYKHSMKRPDQAPKGVWGMRLSSDPVSVGKCAISLGKIVKYPWGVYGKYVSLNA